MMIKQVIMLCLSVVTASLGGCVSENRGDLVARYEDLPVMPKAEPRLRAGDRVQVTVFGEDAITGAYTLSPSGSIQLPLAGDLQAAGASIDVLEASIADALHKKYMRSPKVTVSILSLSPFYVLGEVQKPGEYPFRTGLSIWRALAVAGGQTYRANSTSVLVQHAGDSRVAEVELAQDAVVEPGDLIRVPERWF